MKSHDGSGRHGHSPRRKSQPGKEAVEARHDHEGHHGHTAGEHTSHHHGHDHGDHHGHDAHAHHSVEAFRNRFWLSLVLTIPTLIWGDMLQHLPGFTPPAIPGARWIAPIFGTAVFVYGGRVFLAGAVHELRQRLPGMMTLISLALVVAFAFSLAVLFGFPGMALWEELATLVTVMLLGHWIEMRSIDRAQGALNELAKLLPDTAERVDSDRTEVVPVSDLTAGDVVLVRPGARIPADGTIRSGTSAVNESLITGESVPVDKEPGQNVIAGSVNGSGALQVTVTGTGEETALAGIMRLVSQAQTSPSRTRKLADRAAYHLTYIAVGSGVLTLVAWLLAGATGAYAIERVVTVLVIACPHALGLAIPLVVSISTTLGARSGLLVREQRGLESARLVDTVVFDKTGTLTEGRFGVVDIVTHPDLDEDEALSLAASVEAQSEHAIAEGIVNSARDRGITPRPVEHFDALAGRGVRAVIDGRTFLMGGPRLLREEGVEVDSSIRKGMEAAAERGQASIALIENGHAIAAFAVADVIRDEAKEAVRRLQKRGIEVAMYTGDAKSVAHAVARSLGIETVVAEALPEHKAAGIRELQAKGRRVLMVGDGVNDAPSLVTADVGVAIGAGTDVAVEAGDIILVRNDPRDVVRIVDLSRATYRKMQQNLAWAVGYNVFALPLAAGVLAPIGIVLHPAIGALLMSASTVIVALNAQTLRRHRWN